MSDCQRTNVALTRARYCLWVLGNERTLVQRSSVWNKLIFDVRHCNCFFKAEENPSLAKAMINMKEELKQFEDLLNKDSMLFRNVRWKVIFSDKFMQSFFKLPSTQLKKSVMNILVKLSNGWRPNKISVEPVSDSVIQIAKQYKGASRYIVSTINIIKEASRYIQVLKIWDVVPLKDVLALVQRLDNVYGACSNDFLSRFKERRLDGNLEVLTNTSTLMDIVRHRHRDINAESKVLVMTTWMMYMLKIQN